MPPCYYSGKFGFESSKNLTCHAIARRLPRLRVSERRGQERSRLRNHDFGNKTRCGITSADKPLIRETEIAAPSEEHARVGSSCSSTPLSADSGVGLAPPEQVSHHSIFMSEIPLRSFRRSRQTRAGYTALPEDEHTSSDSQPNGDMPFAGRAAAAASSARNAQKAVMRDRYEDDSEEATLLGDEHRQHETEEDLRVETASHVRVQQVIA